MGQSYAERHKRLDEGRCPEHGTVLCASSVPDTVECPRRDCNFRAVIDLEGRAAAVGTSDGKGFMVEDMTSDWYWKLADPNFGERGGFNSLIISTSRKMLEAGSADVEDVFVVDLVSLTRHPAGVVAIFEEVIYDKPVVAMLSSDKEVTA